MNVIIWFSQKQAHSPVGRYSTVAMAGLLTYPRQCTFSKLVASMVLSITVVDGIYSSGYCPGFTPGSLLMLW